MPAWRTRSPEYPPPVALDVSEATFQAEVVERSRSVPVVVDFWADWCGPCKALTPALEAAAEARSGKVLLAKVDVDANQALAASFGVQGIPAVKAFRDGAVVSEFVGAVPKAQVEAFFDALVPSRADELLAAGDELSLREAAELEPRRADIAVALARKRIERGAEDEALEAVEGHDGDFAAEGMVARIELTKAGIATDAFEALDRGDRDAAFDALLNTLEGVVRCGDEEMRAASGEAGEAETERVKAEETDATRELLRRAIVGILSEAAPDDPTAREHRRRLAAALY